MPSTREETVIAWRRRRFREHWTKVYRSGRPGRPAVPTEVRTLIRRMARSNPTWGAPRIVGELGKIGIDLAKSTVEKYMPRRSTPTSPTWATFLRSHLRNMVAVDFFVVPTVRNKILFVFLVLAPERRRVLHFGVTTNPTAEWTARQIVEAFPWTAPAPRSRQGLRRGVPQADTRDGNRGGSDRTPEALAEPARGATDRVHPSGMPRSRNRVR
jgi:hypothetical protein